MLKQSTAFVARIHYREPAQSDTVETQSYLSSFLSKWRFLG
jgi:hypothetical protein